MESNRCLVFLLFGLSILPKVYSDASPSLFLIKEFSLEYADYVTADKVKKAEGQNNLVEFSTDNNLLYNACPKEDQLLHSYALEVKGQVTDFQPMELERFVKGLFGKYDCERKIKPLALERKVKNGFAPIESQQYDIGFLIYESEKKFQELWKIYQNVDNAEGYNLVQFLTVTLDKESGTIYSVRHKIASGHFLQPDLVFNPLPPNEKNTEEYGYDIDSMYTKENQRNILSPILGKFNPDHSLIKVQLAPAEDFLLDTWKLSSYTDLNTVSMWKQLHFQWKSIEAFVRKVARELQEDLFVETGTGGILELYDVEDQLQPVYLRKDRKSAVPKFVWKTVIIKESPITWYLRAILIVMHNDPYTENQERICNKGKDFGWLVSNDDFKTGLTYVCPVDEDFMKNLHDEFEVNLSVLKLKDSLKLDDEEDDSDEVNIDVLKLKDKLKLDDDEDDSDDVNIDVLKLKDLLIMDDSDEDEEMR